jgi:hypothetical protein
MMRPWPSLAGLAVAACVSFDPAGPAVRDVSGTYRATIVTSIVNQFETRSDTFGAEISVRRPGARGHVTATYLIPPNESGPIEGTLYTDDSFVVTTFGEPPNPIAGVSFIRTLYMWCDFTRIGVDPIPGAFRGDSLTIRAEGSVFCRYRLGGGFVAEVHTQVVLRVAAAR